MVPFKERPDGTIINSSLPPPFDNHEEMLIMRGAAMVKLRGKDGNRVAFQRRRHLVRFAVGADQSRKYYGWVSIENTPLLIVRAGDKMCITFDIDPTASKMP